MFLIAIAIFVACVHLLSFELVKVNLSTTYIFLSNTRNFIETLFFNYWNYYFSKTIMSITRFIVRIGFSQILPITIEASKGDINTTKKKLIILSLDSVETFYLHSLQTYSHFRYIYIYISHFNLLLTYSIVRKSKNSPKSSWIIELFSCFMV